MGISAFNVSSGTLNVYNCYTTGTIGQRGGGIFGNEAGYSSSGTLNVYDCYSTGTIGDYGGGILGQDAGTDMTSSGTLSVYKCYSTGIIGNSGGGILGRYAGSSDEDSFSGTISVNNCYTTGSIGNNGGGIFGQYAGDEMDPSATIEVIHCYTTGSIIDVTSGGIYGSNANTLCSVNNSVCNIRFAGNNVSVNVNEEGSTANVSNLSWQDSTANSSLLGTDGSVWRDIDISSTSIPFLLSSFNSQLYDPNSATTTNINYISSNGLYGASYRLISVNNSISQNYTININNGILTLNNLQNNQTYVSNVLNYSKTSDDQYYGYNINTYTLSVTGSDPLTISCSGSLLIKDTGTKDSNGYEIISYSVNGGSNYTVIDNSVDWPITIVNSTSLTNTLKVTFENDLILNLSNDQYFIMGSDNITVDGTNKRVTIEDISDYPGLIQNGTNGEGGKNSITIENIGVVSSDSSTLAEYDGGWVCQASFSKYTTGNTVINNCYSTGTIGIYGGGILGAGAGDQSSGTLNVSNCYTTGTIGNYGGGILGAGAGFISSGTLSVYNCYSTRTIGTEGGGILGSNAGYQSSGTLSVINCYSTGSIIDVTSGGIYGSNANILCIVNNSVCNIRFAGNDVSVANSNSTANVSNLSWHDSRANSTLLGTDGSIWVDIDTSSRSVPYLLGSYNEQIYEPNSASTSGTNYVSTAGLYSSLYNLLSVSSNVSTNYRMNLKTNSSSTYSINTTTGVLTLNNLENNRIYVAKVLSYKTEDLQNYYGYNINTFTLSVNASITIKGVKGAQGLQGITGESAPKIIQNCSEIPPYDYLYNKLFNQLYEQMYTQFYDSNYNKFENELYDSLYSEISADLNSMPYSSVRGPTGNNGSVGTKGAKGANSVKYIKCSNCENENCDYYDGIYDKLYNSLYDNLYNSINDKLYNQLYDQEYSQLYLQLLWELYKNLDIQGPYGYRGETGSQGPSGDEGEVLEVCYVCVNKDLSYEELYEQLYEKLYYQLYDQLYNNLYGVLYDNLYPELYNKLADNL